MRKLVTVAVLTPLVVMAAFGFSPKGAQAYSSQRASFQVRFKDEVNPYRVIGVFVLPGEMLTIEAVPAGEVGRYVLRNSAGEALRVTSNKWQWKAPNEVGLYEVRIGTPSASDSMLLNVFVMVPFEQLTGEALNGYMIGRYPSIPLRNLTIYRPPRGFIEITPENEATLVSPHFRLNQFVCKQENGYPRYMVLKERLILKLELLLERTNEQGYACSTFEIMSGYRTPYYNRAIGNVRYSRHLWGGAADVFIDEDPRDDMMDDLNKDGKMDYHDADILYDIADQIYGKAWYAPFVGGLARYRKTPAHGPFVHVDVRGFRARWGD